MAGERKVFRVNVGLCQGSVFKSSVISDSHGSHYWKSWWMSLFWELTYTKTL